MKPFDPLEMWNTDQHPNYSSISKSDGSHSTSTSRARPTRSTSTCASQQAAGARTCTCTCTTGSACRLESPSNRRVLSILLGALGLSLISCYLLHKEALSRRGSDVVILPTKTTPTLLSVVDPSTNFYVFAPTNELYDIFLNATFVAVQDTDYYQAGSKNDSGDENNNQHDLPKLLLDKTIIQVHDPLTLSWTKGRDSETGEIVLQDSDILALYCGKGDASDLDFIEAATVQQARATSIKHGDAGDDAGHVNEWFIPTFPNLRQEYCHFRLYSHGVKFQSKYDSESESEERTLVHLASSDLVHIREAKSTPTQLHLALSNDPSKLVVQFTTGEISGTSPIVRCTQADSPNNNDSDSMWFQGKSDTYGAENLCGSPANLTLPGKFYPPGMLHTVELQGLNPNTLYAYQVGLQTNQDGTVLTWSDEYSFTSPPEVGDEREISYIVYGDQGCPMYGWKLGEDWLWGMMQRENPSSIHHFGDLSYAVGSAHVWDGWFDMIQPFAPSIPLMVAVGNHEYDHTVGGGIGKDLSGVETSHGFMPEWGNFGDDSYGECGVPTSKRFQMPVSARSNGVYWYSYSYGIVHTVVISSEHDLSINSPQYTFLEATLRTIDRSQTPWVIVESHRPMYEAEGGNHEVQGNTLVAEAMRAELEDLLRESKVDVVLAGHYHEYHRTCDGVYKGECGAGGPMHITVGSAGAALDRDIELDMPWSLKNIRGKYGYGRITVPNATALHFEFVLHGASDDPSGGQTTDEFWIHRDR